MCRLGASGIKIYNINRSITDIWNIYRAHHFIRGLMVYILAHHCGRGTLSTQRGFLGQESLLCDKCTKVTFQGKFLYSSSSKGVQPFIR